jgi:hypothetical protein
MTNWTEDQPHHKASTYTRQPNTHTRLERESKPRSQFSNVPRNGRLKPGRLFKGTLYWFNYLNVSLTVLLQLEWSLLEVSWFASNVATSYCMHCICCQIPVRWKCASGQCLWPVVTAWRVQRAKGDRILFSMSFKETETVRCVLWDTCCMNFFYG